MLKGFTVIELVKTTGALNVIIDSEKVRFTKDCAVALEYCPYAHFLLDPAGKRLAVEACEEKDAQSIRFSKAEAQQNDYAVIIHNSELIAVLAKMLFPEGEMERVIAPGTFLKAEKAIIFELEKAAPYRRGMRTK